jgi:signal transduction histidine kinase
MIVTNLLENASEYVNSGGSIEISASREGDRTVVRVMNTGCMLAPDQAERVFEPFWRADIARVTPVTHAGLGLAMCRRLAQSLGAELRVRVDGGVFTIRLAIPVG